MQNDQLQSACIKHNQETEHSIHPSVKHMLNVHQVYHGVRCRVKNGRCSSSMDWSERQWTVLLRYPAILTNVSCYQTAQQCTDREPAYRGNQSQCYDHVWQHNQLVREY